MSMMRYFANKGAEWIALGNLNLSLLAEHTFASRMFYLNWRHDLCRGPSGITMSNVRIN